MSIFSLIYFGLVRRALKDGTKSTFLLILAALHVVGSIASVFKILSKGFNPEIITTIISIVFDICVLISIIKVRQEAEEE